MKNRIAYEAVTTTLEAEAEGYFEPKSAKPACAAWQDPVSQK